MIWDAFKMSWHRNNFINLVRKIEMIIFVEVLLQLLLCVSVRQLHLNVTLTMCRPSKCCVRVNNNILHCLLFNEHQTPGLLLTYWTVAFWSNNKKKHTSRVLLTLLLHTHSARRKPIQHFKSRSLSLPPNFHWKL